MTPAEEKRVALRNYLGSISNTINLILYKNNTWDDRILAMQKIQSLIPYIIRYMIYFKNTENNK